jgi:hypothetical protein
MPIDLREGDNEIENLVRTQYFQNLVDEIKNKTEYDIRYGNTNSINMNLGKPFTLEKFPGNDVLQLTILSTQKYIISETQEALANYGFESDSDSESNPGSDSDSQSEFGTLPGQGGKNKKYKTSRKSKKSKKSRKSRKSKKSKKSRKSRKYKR